jgi:hypothetical protein
MTDHRRRRRRPYRSLLADRPWLVTALVVAAATFVLIVVAVLTVLAAPSTPDPRLRGAVPAPRPVGAVAPPRALDIDAILIRW